ncbi:MAG: FmdB family transcriptional regulator [Anaerolineae bacterium]|nr:FmdB family transcriptional regulator [Anaerolineae bacterium]
MDCDNEFEIRQRMTDEPLTECPECEGKIRRVVNSVGVVFKGKGFYVTDNRGNKAQAPSSISGKKEEGSSETSTSSGSNDNKSSSTSTESSPAKSEKSSTAAV